MPMKVVKGFQQLTKAIIGGNSFWLRKHLREYSLNMRYNSLILDIGCGEAPYKAINPAEVRSKT